MTIHATPATNYNLNQDQKAAADAFLEFLFAPEKEFIISGPAGVGKTYLMNYIIDNTMPRYHEMCKLLAQKPEFDDVAMTATTNKAAEVLGKSVKRPAQTFHSFLNLTVSDDYSTGQSTIKRTRNWAPKFKKIIFVDESSMVDTPVWRESHDSTVDCKIVWVGDRHQLAPIHEDLSPIYKRDSPMVELLTPVRNAGQPALMNICSQLRSTVETGTFQPIQVVPGVIDLLDGNQMQAEIDRHFKHQTHEARILAYTNNRVVEYNDHIRSNVRNLPAQYQVGEFLVNNGVFHHRKGTVPVETELEVLRNRGTSVIRFDEEHQVDLHLELLDLEDTFGTILTNVPVPTNREHFESLKKWYGSAKKYKPYFALKNNYADLRPRDAATVHKSQGSTYDTVFVDLGNISTCHQPNQVARMLYVAFSRARTRVFLFGNLVQKYGGLAL